MTRTSDPLHKRGNRAGRPNLHHQVDVSDIDAQLERCRRDDRLKLSRLELPLRL